jgi:hypothetical protein
MKRSGIRGNLSNKQQPRIPLRFIQATKITGCVKNIFLPQKMQMAQKQKIVMYPRRPIRLCCCWHQSYPLILSVEGQRSLCIPVTVSATQIHINKFRAFCVLCGKSIFKAHCRLSFSAHPRLTVLSAPAVETATAAKLQAQSSLYD